MHVMQPRHLRIGLSGTRQARTEQDGNMTTTQLRVYQLSADTDDQDQWLTWWRRARALRERHGFRIASAVLNPENGRFVWVVEHDGDFSVAEGEMVSSAERAEIFALKRPPNTIIETPYVRRIA